MSFLAGAFVVVYLAAVSLVAVLLVACALMDLRDRHRG